MKHLFTLMTLAAMSLTASAAPRSLQSMKDIASSVLFQGTQAKGAHAPSLQLLMSDDHFSVIGSPQGGYAIVSNDDSNEALLGYSDGVFDATDNLNLRWYLAAASEALSTATTRGGYIRAVSPVDYADLPEAVEPIVTATWNQGAPYNLKTPTMSNGSHYVTGCVATALAQILYYNKYPDRGQGINTYIFTPSTNASSITLTTDYSQSYYNWSAMRDTYLSSDTDEGAQQVAKLMSDLGVSVNMQYTPDGSGSYTYQAANALTDYFRCNKGVQMYSREIYSTALWMKKIYKEIHAGRPLYYGGVDLSIRSGHAFVFDGYRSDGLVHVNWGWGGSSNGYFDVALLNPTGYTFSAQQDMILGIADTTVYIPFESQLAAQGEIGFTFSTTNPGRVTIRTSAYNYGSRSFTGKFAAVLMDSEGNQTPLVTVDQTSPLSNGSSVRVSLSSADYASALNGRPDGVYRLYCGAKSARDDDWAPVRTPENTINSYLITKTGTTYTTEAVSSDLWTDDVHAVALSVDRSEMGTVTKHDGFRYNLAGQRVNEHYKGVVIQNGKKYLQR
jgi:hypothetical protein